MSKPQIRNPLHKVSGFSAILNSNNLIKILEEITPPVLRRTMKICSEKTNMSTVKKSYECVDRSDLEIAYENRSAESTEYYCPMPLPLSVQDTLEDISKNIVKKKFVVNNNTVNLVNIMQYNFKRTTKSHRRL